MNKKHGYIFLGLGILLFGLFALFNYTDLFKSKEPSPDNSDNTNTNVNNGTENEMKNYAYIKTHDMNEKIRVAVPIIDETLRENYHSNEFDLGYDNGELAINALVYENSKTIDDYMNDDFNTYKSQLEYNGYTITSNDITCNYLCKNYKIYKDNQLYEDEIRIYIKLSSSDIGVLIYRQESKELSETQIKKILDNITISKDATYKIGSISNNELNIKFVTNKEFNLKLDSSVYDELEKSTNTNNTTIIRNKNNNSEIKLVLRSKLSELLLKEDVDLYHYILDSNMKIEEVVINDIVFYKYDLSGKLSYAYFIDDDNALIISSDSEDINLNDFLNIK